MIGEILTWVGVGIAALFAFMLFRSAERSSDADDSRPRARAKVVAKKEEAA